MAGGWGASIHVPMTTGEEPYIPGRFLPEEAVITPMVDTGVDVLRRQGTLAKALPPVPVLDAGKFSNTNWRAIEAEQYAQAMKASYDLTKAYDRQMRNRAKAKDRARQRWSERR